MEETYGVVCSVYNDLSFSDLPWVQDEAPNPSWNNENSFAINKDGEREVRESVCIAILPLGHWSCTM